MTGGQLYLLVHFLIIYADGTVDIIRWRQSAERLGLKCETPYFPGGRMMTCHNTSNVQQAFIIKKYNNNECQVSIECQTSTPYRLFADEDSVDAECLKVIQCGVPSAPFNSIFKNKQLHTLEFTRTPDSTTLNPSLFQGLDLKKLILPENGINLLNEDLFKTLSNLSSLILSNNLLETIPPNFFISLKKLQALKLDCNKIHKLSKNAFSGLTQLKVLFLSENMLESLPEEIFADLRSLEHLYLSHNNLRELSSTVFVNSPSLNYLDINTNKLTYLPESLLRSNMQLQQLNIASNPLTNLSESLLNGLTMLVNISVQNCTLLKFPEKFFQPAINLEKIEMWNNRLSILPRELLGKMKNLKFLYLSFNDVTSLANLPFNNPKMVHLDMKKNNLTEIPSGVFDNLLSLVYLDLRENFITNVDREAFNSLSRLGQLNLAGNRITSFSGSQPFSLSATIHTIDISENQLTELPEINWAFYDSLKSLKVDKNEIKKLIVPILSSSVNVSLQYNEIITVYLSPDFKNNPYYKNSPSGKPLFYLSHNSFSCDCHFWSFVSFIQNYSNVAVAAIFPDANELKCSSPPHLRDQVVLKVEKDKFTCPIVENCPSLCSCYFRSSDGDTVVNCTGRNFLEFPKVAPKNTNVLHLENNNLTSLKDLQEPLWSNLTALYMDNNSIVAEEWYIPSNLTLLSLQNNRLSWLPKTLKDHLTNYKTLKLKLSNNTWKCDCSVVSFKDRLIEQRILDIQNVTCSESSTGRRISILKLSSEDLCPSPNLVLKILISVAVTSAFLIAICVVLVVYYRNKQTVIAYVYIHFYSFFVCLYKEEEIDEDKLFDAFISYSSADREVALDLLQGLENKDPFYKLCIHERDWVAGNLISWNIAESVQNSRKTILILSPDFLQSIWFQVEFHTAYYQMLEDKIDRFIVVVKGELPPLDTLDKDLQLLLSTKTYLTWGERWFWEKLRFAMPHRKTSPTLLNRLSFHSRAKQSMIKTIEDEISLVTKNS